MAPRRVVSVDVGASQKIWKAECSVQSSGYRNHDILVHQKKGSKTTGKQKPLYGKTGS
jgi:hypothetical protein